MCFREKKHVIKLVPENLLKRRKAYQAIKATQAKLALLEKRKVGCSLAMQWPLLPRWQMINESSRFTCVLSPGTEDTRVLCVHSTRCPKANR